jgi:hypothetical protein
MGIKKLEAAQQQIGTAIWLYFEDRDPISVHTLAAAAGEIIAQLCRSRGVPSFRSMVRAAIKPEHQREAMDKFNEARNFFKHASWKKPDAEFSGFTDDHNLIEIVFAVYGLHAIGEDTFESKMFGGFMRIIKPNWFSSDIPPEALQLLGDIRDRPRSDQKRVSQGEVGFKPGLFFYLSTT